MVLSDLPGFSQGRSRRATDAQVMENTKDALTRVQARNAALQMLNRLTAGVAFAAVAGVGLLGVVSAHTIPGVSASSQAS